MNFASLLLKPPEMILKFLFYAVLFYFLFRFLFGNAFKVNVYHHQVRPNAPAEDREPEGTVTFNSKVKGSGKNGKDQIGEYVDYEEVKE